MKIYTKTGDQGTTSLVGGQRVLKNHIRIEAYGTIDELVSFLAHFMDSGMKEEDKPLHYWIQDRLMTLASILAAENDQILKRLPQIFPADIERLEAEIDRLEQQLPPLQSFILPGGHPLVSLCHICRTICRRAERASTRLNQEFSLDPLLIQFLNRLSDYFFVKGRSLALELKIQEIPWIPKY